MSQGRGALNTPRFSRLRIGILTFAMCRWWVVDPIRHSLRDLMSSTEDRALRDTTKRSSCLWYSRLTLPEFHLFILLSKYVTCWISRFGRKVFTTDKSKRLHNCTSKSRFCSSPPGGPGCPLLKRYGPKLLFSPANRKFNLQFRSPKMLTGPSRDNECRMTLSGS